jgi:hypothetical protein
MEKMAHPTAPSFKNQERESEAIQQRPLAQTEQLVRKREKGHCVFASTTKIKKN